MAANLLRLWETVRHLKAQQIYGRIWHRLYHPKPDHRPHPPLRTVSAPWVIRAAHPPSIIGPRQFRFLNIEGILDEIGWDGEARSKLWRYNQHYFDDLNAADAPARHEWHDDLIDRWITDNPAGQGSGWEPYPVSLRIVNWAKYAISGRTLSEDALQSLAVQARWLTKRLEFHLLGNHLFANGKALVFAGLLFDGPEAQGWCDRGLAILTREMGEQILPDGGHFELSPMYHAIAVEDALDLIDVLRIAGRDASIFEAAVPRMLGWLQNMSHPDGEIAFFNDAAFGIAAKPADLIDYAAHLGMAPIGNGHLAESGYFRMQQGDAVLIADFAQIGPDYLPGHAHADTLSFEFSLGAQRIFVNSGTSEYGLGAERLRQRGTAAHNTVVLDGQNSSDVWSGFRVGRRAHPIGRLVEESMMQCGHNGYRHLKGTPHHHRTIALAKDALTVADMVSAPCQFAVAFLHLHPAIEVTVEQLTLPDGRKLTWQVSGGEAAIEPSTWHPEFGQGIQNTRIVIRFDRGLMKFRLSW